MPYSNKLQFAIDNLIKSTYIANEEESDGCMIQQEKHTYLLIESQDTGYSELTVQVPETNLCITEFDKIPKWGIINDTKKMGMGTAVDHVIFTQNENGHWKAHLIEMKSGMGVGTFESVRKKTRANYYSVKALCIYLGIELNDDDFDVYVTYEEMRCQSDPVLLKSQIGKEPPPNVIKSEWEKNRIIIEIPEILELPLCPVKMEKRESSSFPSGSALIGTITIKTQS